MPSKYDNYFVKTFDSKWKCKLCPFETTVIKDTSTATRQFHLKSYHRNEFDELHQWETFTPPPLKRPRLT